MNAWGDRSWLTPHEEYHRLGKSANERCYEYRELFRHQLSEIDLHRIRSAAHYCQPIGDDRFRQQIEERFGIKAGQMKTWETEKESEYAG